MRIRERKPYDLWEILAIYLIDPDSPNSKKLAKITNRTEGAIKWVWRQIKEGKVIGSDPKRAQNKIQHQIIRIKRLFPR